MKKTLSILLALTLILAPVNLLGMTAAVAETNAPTNLIVNGDGNSNEGWNSTDGTVNVWNPQQWTIIQNPAEYYTNYSKDTVLAVNQGQFLSQNVQLETGKNYYLSVKLTSNASNQNVNGKYNIFFSTPEKYTAWWTDAVYNKAWFAQKIVASSAEGVNYSESEGCQYYATGDFTEHSFAFSADELAAFNGVEAVNGKYDVTFYIQNELFGWFWMAVDDVCLYEIVNVAVEEGGVVDKTSVFAGESVTATANDGYVFDGWYVGENRVSTNATTNAVAGLTAKFKSINLIKNGSANSKEGWYVNSGSTFVDGVTGGNFNLRNPMDDAIINNVSSYYTNYSKDTVFMVNQGNWIMQPVELEAGKTYTLSLKLSANPTNVNITNQKVNFFFSTPEKCFAWWTDAVYNQSWYGVKYTSTSADEVGISDVEGQYYGAGDFTNHSFTFSADELAAFNGVSAVDGKYNVNFYIQSELGGWHWMYVDDVCLYELINVTAGEGGTVDKTIVSPNETVTATANDGYVFDGWYVGDTLISTEKTVVAVSGITAKFRSINLIKNGDGNSNEGWTSSDGIVNVWNPQNWSIIQNPSEYFVNYSKNDFLAINQGQILAQTVTLEEGKNYYFSVKLTTNASVAAPENAQISVYFSTPEKQSAWWTDGVHHTDWYAKKVLYPSAEGVNFSDAENCQYYACGDFTEHTMAFNADELAEFNGVTAVDGKYTLTLYIQSEIWDWYWTLVDDVCLYEIDNLVKTNGSAISYADYTAEQKLLGGYNQGMMGDRYLKASGDANSSISLPIFVSANEKYLVHFKLHANGALRLTSAENGVFTLSNATYTLSGLLDNFSLNPASYGNAFIDVYAIINSASADKIYLTIENTAGGEFGVDAVSVVKVKDLAPTMLGATFNPADSDTVMYAANVSIPEYLSVRKVATYMGVTSELADNNFVDAGEVDNITSATLTAREEIGYLTAGDKAFRNGNVYSMFRGADAAAKKISFSVRTEIELADAYGNSLGITVGSQEKDGGVYSRSINQIKRLLAKSLGATSDVYNGEISGVWDYIVKKAQ